jgi:hypothetical protein
MTRSFPTPQVLDERILAYVLAPSIVGPSAQVQP